MNAVSTKLKAINNLARNRVLGTGPKALFMVLISYCNAENPDRCCPSLEVVAYHLNSCLRSCKTWVHELIDSGCVSRDKKSGKRGSWYVLNFEFMKSAKFTPIKDSKSAKFTLFKSAKFRRLTGYALNSASRSEFIIESQLTQRRTNNMRCTLYEKPSDDTVIAFTRTVEFESMIESGEISWDRHMTKKFIRQMTISDWSDSKGKRIRHWKRYLIGLAMKYATDSNSK